MTARSTAGTVRTRFVSTGTRRERVTDVQSACSPLTPLRAWGTTKVDDPKDPAPGQAVVVYHGATARITTDPPFEECICRDCAEWIDTPPLPVYRLENLKIG